ncbi:excisionase family DNA binding protein [Nocardia tenerifensis]|uniref:Excisionase family DNA binding protein n=1 Tax=Nocardia tenerifensis TaxID=228006 RepID=A0A318KPE9_9NOCA|nr:helix-turn-helix domain-containing protein [Nocardia tenerifensis]PXX64225.1 excisionase family DNA binding protein [Nocardia tenerifensis]
MTVSHLEPDLSRAVRDGLREALASVRTRGAAESTVVIDGVPMEVPARVRDAFLAILDHLSAGRGVAIGTVDELVTTSAAAELLGLSRTYVCRLVDDGTLPAEYRGTHRRIPLRALLDYRDQRKREQRAALDEVANISRQSELYDDQF